MAYLLEWQTDEDRDALCLIRHIRVFRGAGALKAFLRSRAFRRQAGNEVRVQHRARRVRPEAVVTTIEAVLAWNPEASCLPLPLAHSAWAEALTAISLRGHLVEHLAAELGTAQRLALLSEHQVAALLAELRAMLAENAARALSAER